MTPLQPLTQRPPRQVDILLVAVTEHDIQALTLKHRKYGNKNRKGYYDGSHIYYDLGAVGGAYVWLTRSEAGSSTPGGSTKTISNAINALRPAAVILVGTAFGVDPKNQRLGDILVAQRLLSYEHQRISATEIGEKQVVLRGDRVTSIGLLDRFRDGAIHWPWRNYGTRGGPGTNVHFGLVVSCDKQIDYQPMIEDMRQQVPEMIGGEMEGTGLYLAAADSRTDWLMVKGISNWADGSTDQSSTDETVQAANNAAEFTFFTISRGGFRSTHLPTESITNTSIDTKFHFEPHDSNHSIEGYEIKDIINPDSGGNTFIATKNNKTNTLRYLLKRTEQIWTKKHNSFIKTFINTEKSIHMFYMPEIHEYIEAERILVMSWIEGENLERLMFNNRNKMTISFIITAMYEVLCALKHLHKQRIQHGDIKPQNLICDTTGHVWLVGLGASDATNYYQAPEQQQGHGDLPADCYALAMTIAALLTYQMPSACMQHQRLIDQLQKQQPALDADLVHILSEALSEDPTARPSAAVMLDRLQPIRQRYQQALHSHVDSTAETPEQQAVNAIEARNYRTLLAIIEKHAHIIHSSKESFDRIFHQINQLLSQDEINTKDRLYIYATIVEILWQNKLIDEIIAVCHQGIALLPQPEATRVEAVLYQRLGAAYSLILHSEPNNFNIALDSLEKALQKSRLAGDKVLSGHILNNIGCCYDEFGNQDKAEEAYLLSIEIYNETKNRLLTAETLVNLGVIYFSSNNPKQAEMFYRYACDIFKQENRLVRIADTWLQLGILHMEQKSEDLAMRYLQKSKNFYQENNYEQSLVHQGIMCLYNLAEVEISRGNIRAAEEYAQTAYSIFNPLKSEIDSAYEARIACTMAQVLAAQGRSDEAEQIIAPFIEPAVMNDFEIADVAFIYYAFAIAISQKDKIRAEQFLFDAHQKAHSIHINWLVDRIAKARDRFENEPPFYSVFQNT